MFLCRVERNLLQLNKKIFQLFLKKKGIKIEIFFYKLKKLKKKAKEKNYFCEIRTKKVRSKMD